MKRFSETSRRCATRFALLVTALAAFFLSACLRPAPAPSTPADQAVENARLEAEVRAALLDKLGSDAMTIEPSVTGNRVVLDGTVVERSSQELAEEVATAVRGIRKVRNRLRIQDDGAGVMSEAVSTAEDEVRDAVVEARLKSRILGEIGRFGLEIEVEVADGVASLRGWLPDAERKGYAMEAARATPGVDKVIDLLRVGLE
ncbi:MAG: BON domain-containing protein [Acidobacteriota bacterium]